MNKFLLVLMPIVIGVIVSSFVWVMILHSHEMGHRNFEYVQCEQFWELAEKYVPGDYERFDCDLILEHGVLSFNPKESSNNIANDVEVLANKEYAYQSYVDDVKGRKAE